VVRLAGSQRDLLDDNSLLSLVRGEEKSIIADAPPEYALPLRTLEGLYAAPERVGCHLRQDAGHAFLNSFREAAKIRSDCR
jgi:hypothetical protein